MQIIRAILRVVILFFDRLFAPTPEVRSVEAQAKVDAECAGLALYHFEACPFCVRVRRHITRRNLKIDLRDVKRNREFDKELVKEGGKFQVPCLKITDSNSAPKWLYESADIIEYLDKRFPKEGSPEKSLK